jgi:signal transduction histidine kinase
MHVTSLAILELVLSGSGSIGGSWAIMSVILGWATWASAALAGVLKETSRRLERANSALERQSSELERKVAARTAELQESQTRLIHQEKMAAFGLVAAGIAHEIGNPLAAISSIMQMLARRGPEPYTAEKLELVERQVQRIQRTLRDLLGFSRPSRKEPARFTVSDVMEDVQSIARYDQRTGRRGIQIELAPELPPMTLVRDHVTQILLNLLLNAIDSTTSDGEIRLTAKYDGRMIRFEIDDDGNGVETADRERLFQPFYSTKPNGTGLGLFVSRQLAQELGGSLVFEPRPPTGSRFVLKLPACVSPPVNLLESALA